MSKFIVGSARISENGTVYGQPGDQANGGEVAMQPFYMHKLGWVKLRPISPLLAKNLAISMIQACENNNIGYSQNLEEGVVGRLGVYAFLKKNPDKQIKDINFPCNCDCSGLIRACVYQTTNKKVNIPNFNTASAVSVLENTRLFYPAKAIRGEQDLRVGDILCTPTKGHIVIVCGQK